MVKIAPNTYEVQDNNGLVVNSVVNLDSEFARFPYPLSPFQKHSIEAITKGQSVLVTAHTGSGKTVPAEFAIQYFVERGKKVIYCSPIKALSNQKFYEFQKKYPHISFGLLTGDNKINAAADCLIMTTEILMNRVNTTPVTSLQAVPNTLQGVPSYDPYALSINIETELAAVIFDEVHYINDAARGHVWERTIMSLPVHVQLILLSATIDQPVQFAEWIEQNNPCNNKENKKKENENNKEQNEKNKKREVVLCSTTKRVVPLGHYSFVTTTEAAFKKIKDKTVQQQIRASTNKLQVLQTADGKFQDAAFHDISTTLKHLEKAQIDMKRKFVLNKLLDHLTEQEMTPAILFLFSRKQVELCAQDVTSNLLEFDSKVPYVARKEAEHMIRKLPNYAEYMALPEYETLVTLLEKGVGIHHAGMIPVFREIVELFISKKYIKLLVATESFAIGLDCPIKSAIFTGFTKWDGTQDRMLMPHEYTQMAGRAGRRGIDTIGYVIHCNNVFPMPCIYDYKTLLSGKPERFQSKFKITYSIVLNQLQQHQPPQQQQQPLEGTTLEGTTLENVAKYVNGSMASADRTKRVQAQAQHIAELEAKARKYIGITDACNDYLKKKRVLNDVSHKRRKELEREMSDMAATVPGLLEDVRLAEENDGLLDELEEEMGYAHSMTQYSLFQIQYASHILAKNGFVTMDRGGTIHITPLGQVAAQIREVNGLLVAQLLRHTNNFENLSVDQIVALLSCFIEVREERDTPMKYGSYMQGSAEYAKLLEMKDAIETMECEWPDFHGKEPIVLQNRLYNRMLEWCQCTTEMECKYFVQTRLPEVDMSLGDFVKVVLKLVAACKELAVAVSSVQLQHKLSQADILLSKFIMTSQSLYL